jgi:hypothetical protein
MYIWLVYCRDRYGSQFLPKTIDGRVFEARLATITDTLVTSMAREWYQEDTNVHQAHTEGAPRSTFVLRNLTSDYQMAFNDDVTLSTLLDALDGVPFDEGLSPELVVNRSVTEWETKVAVQCEVDPACSRMLCLHRTFPGGIPDTAANGLVYCDHTHNPSKRAKHTVSQQWALSQFPTDRIVTFNGHCPSSPRTGS